MFSSSFSDIAFLFGESIEFGFLSDVFFDEELCMFFFGTKKYIDEKLERVFFFEKNESYFVIKFVLI